MIPLLENILSIDSKEKDYGSYLMFDIDTIDNNKDYEQLKNKKSNFISLFNEMDVSNIEKDNYKNVFPNKLKEYNFKLSNDKVSLISVVFNDTEFNLLFVGHAGVLIDLGDKYLFVEKIAFEQPYQISILKEKKDLVNLFKDRPSYFGDDAEEGPFIYENDKLIYEF